MRKVVSKQSLWSKILNFSFIFTSGKKNSCSVSSAKKFIAKSSKLVLDENMYKDFNKENIDDSFVYTYNGTLSNNNSKFLLYVHGGNFVEHANKYQIKVLKKIAKETNSTLIFVIYELLPTGNYKKMFILLNKIYDKLLSLKPQVINFIGDSAGAGSILSFAQQIASKDDTILNNIILISPWLDLSMTNPTLYRDALKDNMNNVDGTRYEGKLWANEIDCKDPRVSPIYGEFDKLKKISIIFGGRGILSSECKRFDKILNDKNIEHNYIMYEHEGHDFVFYPTREGEEAINDIITIIS